MARSRLRPSFLAALLVPIAALAEEAAASPEQVAQYEADAPKTIIELQQFRHRGSIPTAGPGGRSGTATLVDLNPNVNVWFLLTLDWGDGKAATYHLENPDPGRQRVSLAEGEARGLVIANGEERRRCDLWSSDPTALEQAKASALPYAPLCDRALYLRNPVAGRRTDLERVTDLLRDHVWGGEAIIGFVRDQFFKDAHREEGTPGSVAEPAAGSGVEGPRPAALSEAYAGRAVVPEYLGIAVAGPASGQLTLGQWYPAANVPGVHLGVIQPQVVAAEILRSHQDAVAALDSVEASALDYLVAFDLAALEVDFALGADHPRLDWSPRPPADVRGGALPGPDGVATTAPLVINGLVSPARVGRTVATFTGGFKRTHGAFKYGDLALRNRGSHYGFIEAGTVFSKLQPDLATMYRLEGGTLEMGTWSRADDASLARIEFARQNGVPLVATDPATGRTAPGALVNRWGPGNWSGSAEGQLRALRAGACFQEVADRRYLIYAYFSTATPSAMARVFQAYGCRYGMLLDMNALEHTYLALYHRQDDRIVVEHLIRGMEVVDKSVDDQILPRFIAFPDNRDFFYVMRREGRP